MKLNKNHKTSGEDFADLDWEMQNKDNLKLIIIFILKEKNFEGHHRYENLSSEEKSKIFDLMAKLNLKVKNDQ